MLRLYRTVVTVAGSNPSLSMSPVSADAGALFTAPLATFQPPSGYAFPYQAMIVWGDSSAPTAGTIVSNGNGSYGIEGSHLYQLGGPYSVSVTVTDSNGNSITAYTTAMVANATLTSVALSQLLLPATAAANANSPVQPPTQNLDNIVVAKFTDPNTADVPTSFDVNVDWGDGTGSGSAMVLGGGGLFYVVASHGYDADVAPGWFEITTSIHFTQSTTTYTAQRLAIVTPLAEGSSVASPILSWAEDTLQPAQVGGAAARPLIANVTWGDNGQVSTASVGGRSDGFQGVTPNVQESGQSHTFLNQGSYNVTITTTNNLLSGTTNLDFQSNDVPLSQAVAVDTFYVAAPAPVWTSQATSFNQQALATNSSLLPLATFTDSDPMSAYDSAMVYWGDGTTPLNALVLPWGAGYGVFASHAYQTAGAYNYVVEVTNYGYTLANGASYSGTSIAISGSSSITAVPTPWAPALLQRYNDETQGNMVSVGEASVALNTGGLRLTQPLDFDLSPGTSEGRDPGLVYNSDTVAVRPILELQLPIGGNPVPRSISVTLTWNNGIAQAPVFFYPTGHNPGDVLDMAVQVNQPVAAAGLYSYQVAIQINLPNGTVINTSAAGNAVVVACDASSIGAGWLIEGIDRLYVNANGALLVDGDGDADYFNALPGGRFQGPSYDFGTLQTVPGQGYVYTTPDKTRYYFNPSGFMTSVTDANNNVWTYGYNSSNLLVSVQTPDKGYTTLQYNSSGLLTTINEPDGRTVTLSHDSLGNITGITDADDTTRTFTYASGTSLLIGDQWYPIDTTFTYNAATGKLSSVNQGLGTITTIKPAATVPLMSSGPVPNAAAVRGIMTDAMGHSTLYTMDAGGRVQVLVTPDRATTTYAYDSTRKLVTAVTDALGNTTGYQLDANLPVVDIVTSPDTTFTKTSYDPAHLEALQQINQLGRKTINNYDAFGDLLTTVNPLTQVTTNTWSSDGQVSTTQDPLGATTTYQYDSDLRQTTVIDALGDRTTTTYDDYGNVASVEDARGDTSHTQYNAVNELTLSTDAAGDTTSYAYDAAGYMIGSTAPDNLVTVNQYDQRGLEISVTETGSGSLSRTTTNSYVL